MSPQADTSPLIPARMLNEFVYCPRLAILEWVVGEWAASADTVEGSIRNTAVDRPGFLIRRSSGEGGATEREPLQLRSVALSGEELGLTAKIDLVEVAGSQVQPVDYKKGKRPHMAAGVWERECVQLCAQGLPLRADGHACDSGILYFAGSNERVTVEFDEDLVAETREKIRELRAVATRGVLPPPLEDSPKCPRCSLVSIGLPDETRWLTHGGSTPVPRLH